MQTGADTKVVEAVQIEAEFIAKGLERYVGMDLKEYAYGQLINSLGEMETLKLDVILPIQKAEALRPVVIFLHGGGFHRRSDKRQTYVAVFARAFTEAGYAVIAPDYLVYETVEQRDAAGGYGVASRRAAEGIHLVYEYVQEHAEEMGWDAARIAVMGGSAGGMTGFAAISGYPQDAYRLFVNCWGCPPELPELAGFPPVLSIHGTEDKAVSYQNELVLHERLKRLGIRNELITLEGSGHTPIDRFGEYIPAIMSWLAGAMK